MNLNYFSRDFIWWGLEKSYFQISKYFNSIQIEQNQPDQTGLNQIRIKGVKRKRFTLIILSMQSFLNDAKYVYLVLDTTKLILWKKVEYCSSISVPALKSMNLSVECTGGVLLQHICTLPWKDRISQPWPMFSSPKLYLRARKLSE